MTYQEQLASLKAAQAHNLERNTQELKDQADVLAHAIENFPTDADVIRTVAGELVRIAVKISTNKMHAGMISDVEGAYKRGQQEQGDLSVLAQHVVAGAIERVRDLTAAFKPAPKPVELLHAASIIYAKDAALRNIYIDAAAFIRKCECEITQWLPLEK